MAEGTGLEPASRCGRRFSRRREGHNLIRCNQVVFEKLLDTIVIDTLYKRVRAMIASRTVRKKLSMMTSRRNKQHSTKWQPCAAMYVVVCALGLSSASVSLRTNIFGGRLGQEASIDSRRIRQ